jgi:hypothetical protein
MKYLVRQSSSYVFFSTEQLKAAEGVCGNLVFLYKRMLCNSKAFFFQNLSAVLLRTI